ncbi:metallophosphoesterase family protein [Faecalibaculum rodentium]|jgi:hypothetical protein|uniref:metallophosphoesterase family protein n=1 Tax=Faecalibaculum rodentium TaxID=1702221 RepID=UPI00248F884F|nr:metallophosphoesterase [Faecalibaculum rodentium]
MIYITGDIHREQDIHKINPREFEAGNHLTPDDYVIICGDFGCIWYGGSGDRFWLNWLESLPWNTLFIDGNHENFDVLNTYPIVDYKGGKARQIRSNIFHLLRGEVYDIGGRSFFTFGGAFSHDVQYRTEHLNWWQDELPTKEECENGYRNLNACNWKVDYVLTHDVYESHPMAGKYEKSMDHYDASRQDIQKYLDDIVDRLDYRTWFTGHYHGDWIHTKNNRPCVTLFERVVLLEDLENELKTIGEVQPPKPQKTDEEL